MTEVRITKDDLDWWVDFAAARDWTFATTYALTAPHDYIVGDRTPGVTREDVVRAARVICTYGVPGKYYAITKIYLESPDGRHRWWTEDRHFTDATLVNRGPTDVLFGIQNAPATTSGIDSAYDQVATGWDAEHPPSRSEADDVRRMLSDHRGTYPPHVLDLGCGTGRVLDIGLVPPERYAGVDSSQAMLNVLVRKHPKVAAVYPADVRELLNIGMFTRGQFDWVFLDGTVELDSKQRSQAERIARRAVITVTGATWEVVSVAGPGDQRAVAVADRRA